MCARIGQGHVTVAQALASDLLTHNEVAAVELRDDLRVLGAGFGRFMELGLRAQLRQIGSPTHPLRRLSYELGYRLFFERALPRRAGHLALMTLGGRGLLRTIAAFGADVVVADYPVLSAALGELRARGRLSVPVCSLISEPAGLWYWAHPGIDLHLLCWPEALAEAQRIAGTDRAAVVRPMLNKRILHAPARSAARATLGLPLDQTLILVSGGGWGIGDLSGAATVALATVPDATVICLSGHSRQTQLRLRRAHAGNSRVRILGFTEQMPELLAAADAVIHTTGGTTALEARVIGCRLINYGSSVAHVRRHAQALQEWGVGLWAKDRAQLAEALPRSLAQAPPQPLNLDAAPDAANLVLKLPRARQLHDCEIPG